MKGLALAALAALVVVGCAKKEDETAKAPDAAAPAADGKGPGGAAPQGGRISMADAKPTFPAVTEIFNKRCTSCHGGTGRSAAGYDLTSYDAVMKGGRGGADIVAGDEKSPLVLYLTGNKSPRMPKNGAPLDPADIDLIKAWIKAGAKNE